MLTDPRDRAAYQIAIACFGLALAIVLAGVIVIVALSATSSTTQTTSHTTSKWSHVWKSRGDPKWHDDPESTWDSSRMWHSQPRSDPASKAKTVSETTVPLTRVATTLDNLYIIAGALAGVLLGILIPIRNDWIAAIVSILAIIAVPIIVAFVVLNTAIAREAVAAVSAGALLGLLVPSPATRR